ncbi:MAG: methylenetetrahydrofolate reductase [Burkholderiaceae bacterium]|nr:methylenetetrahydrofolate reductase [Burkholderiaceae bacterium]
MSTGHATHDILATSTGADPRDAIARLARDASIETSTRNVADVGGYAQLLAPGTDVSITFLPGTPYHHILSTATRLRQVGLNPVPHLAARRFASAAAVADFAARLRDEAGVSRVLLIAGDSQAAAGPFSSSLQVLETGVFEACGIRSIGVAGYPEGHRAIPGHALDDALDRKIRYAEAHGIELFVVSQFCFDGRLVLDWLERLRDRGVTVPVRVGVAGPATVRTLLAYATRCGIGASMKALGSRPVSLTRLVAHQGPERLARGIAPRAAELGVAGLHLFAFGNFADSARWIRDVAAGRFRLDPEGDGFELGSSA